MRALQRTHSAEETEALGERLGRTFQGGEVCLLRGELGAGKTTLVRGLARGLDIVDDEISSPTFVLLTSHRGRLVLYHADLYRIEGRDTEIELSLAELPGASGVLVIEWSERLGEMHWERWLRIDLEHDGEDARTVRVVEEHAA